MKEIKSLIKHPASVLAELNQDSRKVIHGILLSANLSVVVLAPNPKSSTVKIALVDVQQIWQNQNLDVSNPRFTMKDLVHATAHLTCQNLKNVLVNSIGKTISANVDVALINHGVLLTIHTIGMSALVNVD